eukprot:sb/3477624/
MLGELLFNQYVLGCSINIVIWWFFQETDHLKENKWSYGISGILGSIPIPVPKMDGEVDMPIQRSRAMQATIMKELKYCQEFSQHNKRISVMGGSILSGKNAKYSES